MPNPYIPFILPNNDLIDINKIINKLINANTKIAVYNEKLKNSKIRSELLMDLLSLKEAMESTKIEGTQVTMDEMFEYKADEKHPTNDITEVNNYYNALKIGEDLLRTLPISGRFIKKLHETLMSGNVRGGNKSPGNFRTTQNYIGPKGCTIETASFVPPEPQLVDEYMSNLEKYINEYDDINDLIKLAIIHSQFETIHPFLDGNGRIGRILIPLYLFDKKILRNANFFVSESLEKDKFKYYQLLNNTRVVITDEEDNKEQYLKDMQTAKNNFTEWVEFFLESCIKQCDKDLEKIDAIDSLYENISDKAKELIRTPGILQVIDLIFEYPIFTTKLIRDKIKIAPATLNGYLAKLVEAKVIYSDGKNRNRKYFFYDLLNIIR
ncbi:Fic family protein [uncultured Clostridium sp.]|uniref:Fic family protein n=1 Tax=uncultured Clostridium sp. TaxID=59620 RepID=UPI0025D07241|nr:Fic family protein [uncultured Clostridium sp.]